MVTGATPAHGGNPFGGLASLELGSDLGYQRGEADVGEPGNVASRAVLGWAASASAISCSRRMISVFVSLGSEGTIVFSTLGATGFTLTRVDRGAARLWTCRLGRCRRQRLSHSGPRPGAPLSWVG